MDRSLRWYDYLTINAYWFALTTRAQALSPLIVPLLVQRFVGDEVKGTYLGQMRLVAIDVHRPNLRLEARSFAVDQDKRQALQALCRQIEGSGIVYATSRAKCESLATMLQRSLL